MPQDKLRIALPVRAAAGQSGDERSVPTNSLRATEPGRAWDLAAPGGIYLMLAFIVPLILVVYTAVQSGGLLGGYQFTWAFENCADAFASSKAFIARALLYSASPSCSAILLAYPMAYWIAFYAGRWKSTLFFLILVPFFVSFVIRTVQWNFILADDGVLFGFLKDLGLLPDNFRVLAGPVAVVAGITYNFPAVYSAAALRCARPYRQGARRGGAKDLYATKFEAFRKVVLPLSFPGLFAASC